jgi:branched-chain amino acid transport system permease protein
MVMIGGPRLLLGPIAGGILVSFLPEVLNLDPVESRILYGVCLIAVILLLPNGLIAGILQGWQALFKSLSGSGDRKTAANSNRPSGASQ